MANIRGWHSPPKSSYITRTMNKLHTLALLTAMSVAAHAGTLEPVKDSTQATVLETQVGKTVELQLKSGGKIGGKVTFVGENLVHLSSLTGMEMYEATVTLDDITAVVVRSAK